jgi:ribosomal-protein-alanine N-acetyltransferase
VTGHPPTAADRAGGPAAPAASGFPACLPTLAGPSVILRALTDADIPGWFARATDTESAILAGDAIPASIAEGETWLARHRARFRSRTGLRWAIVPAGATASVGTIGLVLATPGATCAELGYVLARSHWNRGLGTSAARLVTRYAFATLGLAEIHAAPLPHNVASRRVLEKAGFRFSHIRPGDPAGDPDETALYTLTAACRTDME